ncbi:uncharacterized protein LOC131317690 [Rhododendron vialii]|uniref:uncharacterized protein LOC131317690 n=1 Tax=Rhododendron vialii TaxID=182163 RepID=UPI0026600157|nr:uncharacterized protein LOC131317690 [Rhododendron vialii]XP_058203236.1 uncharacterized protein LOC131317690 [Rhododendron vialii]
MLKFISKSAAKASPSPRIVYFYQTHPFSSSPKSVRNSPNQHSFTVNYFINSFGFSPEEALSASKYIKFDNPHKPDVVVELFKNHGFTQTEISSLIRNFPRVLGRDAQKNLLPKLEFFKSRGLSSADVARIASSSPLFLKSSLEYTIIPAFDFVSNLFKSKGKAMAAMKRLRRISLDQLTRMNPNIATLRETGVSDSSITYLLINEPGAFMMSYDKFRRVVEEVQKMGFSPSKVNFVVAIRVLGAMTKSTWNKKVKIYRKWGLTEDEISVAFKKRPWFMTTSEDKINRVMDFFVNKMGWEPLFIARDPRVIQMSLEKRVVPRSAVYEALLLQGLIKASDISLTTLLNYPEKQFLKKIWSWKKEEAPKLLKLYNEKLDHGN